MPSFSFTVPGTPKSERKMQIRMGPHARRVDTPDRKDWKVHVRACIQQALPADWKAVDGPVTLTIRFYKEKPKSYPKRPTKGKPFPFDWITKPDATNVCKLIEDCMNDMHVWHDDAQVTEQHVYKAFDDVPRTDVTVEWGVSPTEEDGSRGKSQK
jgi:Holliday junction resolvase RusA-like endonuclease